MPSRFSILGASLLPLVIACGGKGDADQIVPPTESPASDAGSDAASQSSTEGGARGSGFAALDAYLDARMAGGLHGYALQIYGADGKLAHQREAGTCATTPGCPKGNPAFTTDLVTGIASSSKWVTSTTVLAVLDDLVAQGKAPSIDAALDAKVAPILACPGVTGPVTDITMRHLLSFTSGVIAGHPCVSDRDGTLQSCACDILRDSAKAMTTSTEQSTARQGAHAPGTTFKYGESHHAVAGAVVEKITGTAWSSVFQAKIQTPLGTKMTYKSVKNLAGSMEASVSDYAKFVRGIQQDALGNKVLLSKVAVEAQRASQIPAGAARLIGPQPGFDYGLNNWRWCYSPFDEATVLGDLTKLSIDNSCSQVFQTGHGGKGGYQPFIDAQGRYFAVFASREESAGAGDQYNNEELALTMRVRLLTHLAMVPR
jgi:serine-type D-Ala-D-Ala carboxypeptidase/endopeptidase